MPIAWAELPAPVQQLVYDGLGVMGVLALNREWRACRERRVAERLPCDTHNVPSSLPGTPAPPNGKSVGQMAERSQSLFKYGLPFN